MKQPVFAARDLRDLASLSYRQLNEWEAKGVLPSDPHRREGWRRYSPGQVFAILVCAEIRGRFSVPLETLSWLSVELLADEPAVFDEVGRLRAHHRSPIFLVTDLCQVCEVVPRTELSRSLRRYELGTDASGSYLAIRLDLHFATVAERLSRSGREGE